MVFPFLLDHDAVEHVQKIAESDPNPNLCICHAWGPQFSYCFQQCQHCAQPNDAEPLPIWPWRESGLSAHFGFSLPAGCAPWHRSFTEFLCLLHLKKLAELSAGIEFEIVFGPLFFLPYSDTLWIHRTSISSPFVLLTHFLQTTLR